MTFSTTPAALIKEPPDDTGSMKSDAGWTFLGSLHDVNVYEGTVGTVAMIQAVHAMGSDMMIRSMLPGSLPVSVLDPDPHVTWGDVHGAIRARDLARWNAHRGAGAAQ